MNTTQQIPKLVAFKSAMLALAPLQITLRDAIAERMKTENLTLNQVARSANIGWTELRRFMDGERVIGTGKGLEGLARYMNVVDLGQQIETLAKPYSSMRQLALAAYDPVVILLVCDLWVRFHENGGAGMKAFSNAFDAHAEIVFAILQYRREGFDALKDANAAKEILQTLQSEDLPSRIQAALKKKPDVKDASETNVGTECKALIDRLVSDLGSLQAVAEAAKIPRSTLGDIRNGAGSEKRLQSVYVALQRVQKRDKPVPVSREQHVQPSATDDAHAFVPVVPVLTQATFGYIDDVPSDDELRYMRTYLLQARVMLERCAQMRSERARARVRNMLTTVVEELAMAAKIFSHEFPNRMLHLYDAERLTQQALAMDQPSKDQPSATRKKK